MGDEDFGLPGAGLPKSSSRSNLPASEAGSAALVGRAGVAGADVEHAGRREGQRTAVVGGALRNPGDDRFRYVAGRDPDHPIVGRRGDVGVDQPVLQVRRRHRDAEQAPVTLRVQTLDGGHHHRFGARRHPQDAAGRALADQRRRPVGKRREPGRRGQARGDDGWVRRDARVGRCSGGGGRRGEIRTRAAPRPGRCWGRAAGGVPG